MKQDEGTGIDEYVRSAKRKDDSFVQATHLLLSEITVSVPDHVPNKRTTLLEPKHVEDIDNTNDDNSSPPHTGKDRIIPRLDG